jgi:hypothetical protein
MSSSRSRTAHSITLAAVLILVVATVVAGAGAQGLSPAEAAFRAVALLEQDGYTTSFRLIDGGLSGLARYQSSGAYALEMADADGAATEYILLDPILYARVTPRAGPPSAWEWMRWHADIPVPGLAEYHPRLPLELLRAANDWREAGLGADGARRLEGTVRYITAFYAAYEDSPTLVQERSALGTMRWPLAVELDPIGGLPRALSLEIPAGFGGNNVPAMLSYGRFSPGPRLSPPDAVEGDAHLAVRDAPSGALSALPLTLQGEGRSIRTPVFHSEAGMVSLRLSPGQSGVQLALWRVKRGRSGGTA